jgi:hypothetical protein
MRELGDAHFPGADRIRVVMHTLSPHSTGALDHASRLAKRKGGKLIFGPPYGIIQHRSAAFGPRANFPPKRSFPQNFHSAPPIPAENRPNGEEVA